MRRLALLLPLALLIGCGGGPKVTENRDLPAYAELQVSGDANVDIVPGDTRGVVVTGGRDIIDRVRTEVEDGVLKVSIKDHGIVIGKDPFDDVRVQVSAGALKTINVAGTSDLQFGELDRDALTINISGPSDIEASGTVGALTLDIEGPGDAHLSELAARTAEVNLVGAGDAELNVSDELNVHVEGSGDVTYRGHPSVRQSVEGSGEVRPED